MKSGSDMTPQFDLNRLRDRLALRIRKDQNLTVHIPLLDVIKSIK